MITFGPVPSRRLGKSLGINNIPSRKLCSYSCMYCQVGITKYYTINRETFYSPDVIFSEMIGSGYIAKVEHDGHFYYLRKFKV